MIFILLGGVPIIVGWCALFFGWVGKDTLDKRVNRELANAIVQSLAFILCCLSVIYGFTLL